MVNIQSFRELSILLLGFYYTDIISLFTLMTIGICIAALGILILYALNLGVSALFQNQSQELCCVPGTRIVTSMNCSNQVPLRSQCGDGHQAPTIRYSLLEYQCRHIILPWLEYLRLRGLTRNWHVAVWSLKQRIWSHSPHKRYWRPRSSPPPTHTHLLLWDTSAQCTCGWWWEDQFSAHELLFWGCGTKWLRCLQ